MIIGFTITDYNGYEQEALDFLKEYCVVNQPGLLESIVASGPGVNIFPTQILTEEILDAQPFSYEPITTLGGVQLLISGVNFVLEVPIGDEIQRIKPADFFYVESAEAYLKYINKGFLVVIGQSLWILYTGFWVDSNFWDDFDSDCVYHNRTRMLFIWRAT